MTPEQAAEVLRRHLQWRKQEEHESDIAYVGPDALTAALETAIECMSASTPTDEQIGKLFDQHTDVSVLLNPISPTHAMTRTAAIQFARDVLTLGKSK